MNFGKVFEIFPGVDTRVLCTLSELSERLPSKVRALVPEASAVQIAAFMNLVEEARNQQRKEERVRVVRKVQGDGSCRKNNPM